MERFHRASRRHTGSELMPPRERDKGIGKGCRWGMAFGGAHAYESDGAHGQVGKGGCVQSSSKTFTDLWRGCGGLEEGGGVYRAYTCLSCEPDRDQKTFKGVVFTRRWGRWEGIEGRRPGEGWGDFNWARILQECGSDLGRGERREVCEKRHKELGDSRRMPGSSGDLAETKGTTVFRQPKGNLGGREERE